MGTFTRKGVLLVWSEYGVSICERELSSFDPRSSGNMGKSKFQDYLPDECYRKYSCRYCRANLANHDELISKVHLATAV